MESVYIYNVATHVQHAPACLLSARPPRGGSLLLRRRRSDALRCMQGLLFIPRHINERAASLLWVRYEHASSIDKTHYEQHVRRWTPSTKRPCAQAKDFWWDVNIPIRAWNISSIAKSWCHCSFVAFLPSRHPATWNHDVFIVSCSSNCLPVVLSCCIVCLLVSFASRDTNHGDW